MNQALEVASCRIMATGEAYKSSFWTVSRHSNNNICDFSFTQVPWLQTVIMFLKCKTHLRDTHYTHPIQKSCQGAIIFIYNDLQIILPLFEFIINCCALKAQDVVLLQAGQM